MKRHCFALDLIDDPELIAEYDSWHHKDNGWPEVRKSIIDAHILAMEIYRTGNRLFMIMDVSDEFSADRKAKLDAENTKVQEWEQLMWKFQQPLPWAQPGQKWIEMSKIFDLSAVTVPRD